MKRMLIAAGAACLAFPGAAHASETYFGISGGVSLAAESANAGEFTANVPATPDWGAIPSGTSLAWNTEFDTGFALSGQFGLKFDNGLRTEVEVAYTRNGVKTHSGLAAGGAVIDAVDVAVLTRGAPNASNPTVGQVIADGQGDVSSLGGFINVFYDVPTGSSFEPYIGGGLGYRQVTVDFQPSGVPVADDSDAGFAWQLMAGGTFAVSNSVDLYAQYTYRRNFDRADVALDLLPATLGVETDQSVVAVGLRVKLGN